MKSGLISNTESRDTLPNRSSLSHHSLNKDIPADQQQLKLVKEKTD